MLNNFFENSAALRTFIFPENIIYMPAYFFKNCSRLASVGLTGAMTYIGAGGFQNCTSLTEVTLPESVTTLRTMAFRGCTNLRTVNLSNITTYERLLLRGVRTFRDTERNFPRRYDGDSRSNIRQLQKHSSRDFPTAIGNHRVQCVQRLFGHNRDQSARIGDQYRLWRFCGNIHLFDRTSRRGYRTVAENIQTMRKINFSNLCRQYYLHRIRNFPLDGPGVDHHSGVRYPQSNR